jgi:hypothetical protein
MQLLRLLLDMLTSEDGQQGSRLADKVLQWQLSLREGQLQACSFNIWAQAKTDIAICPELIKFSRNTVRGTA